MMLRTFPELPQPSGRHGNPQHLPMYHVFREFATPEVWLSYYYLPLNADTVIRFFASAEAVTGDNAIAAISAAQLHKERHTVRLSGGTGRRKKAGKPIAGRNIGDG